MATQSAQGGPQHEFRFVVSGLELTKAQQQRIADAVAQAGGEALAALELPQPASTIQFVPREWIGRYIRVLAEPALVQQIAQITGADKQLGR